MPAFCGNRRFTTVFKEIVTVHSLSQMNPILTLPYILIFTLILFSHIGLHLPSGLFPSGFPTNLLISHLPHGRHMPHPTSSLISFILIIWGNSTYHAPCRYAVSSRLPSTLSNPVFSRARYSQTMSICVLPSVYFNI